MHDNLKMYNDKRFVKSQWWKLHMHKYQPLTDQSQGLYWRTLTWNCDSMNWAEWVQLYKNNQGPIFLHSGHWIWWVLRTKVQCHHRGHHTLLSKNVYPRLPFSSHWIYLCLCSALIYNLLLHDWPFGNHLRFPEISIFSGTYSWETK